MILKKWSELPPEFRNEQVRTYYDILSRKKFSLVIKRIFDIVISLILLTILSPVFLILAIAIKVDSRGPVFYRQERVTRYGKIFRIFKFRTMVHNADKIGSQITVSNDARVTRVGKLIRKCRLDEISQLIDVFKGTMTFVGTRPEVPKYTQHYTEEMMATLLLPAGVTSTASIAYKDEARLLDSAQDPDKLYIQSIMPQKMRYNLADIKNFGLLNDIKLIVMTALAILGKEFNCEIPPQEQNLKQEVLK